MIMRPHLVTGPPFWRQCRDPIDLAQVAILLDVDGTILDVAPTPQSVAVPASLVRTLAALHTRTNGALALVSGRLIENLDRLFVPLKLPCVGGHGVECPHCGHRMAITAVAPALYANGAASNDLEDVTHTCLQCGTTQISTRRSFSSDILAIAHRI
jgi:trehalose-phosphatase